MEDTDNDNMPEEGGLWERIKESPRTVSALIIILIVAAAIYAFSGEDSTDVATTDLGDITAITEDEVAAGEQTETAEPQVAAEVTGQTEAVGESTVETIESSRTAEGFVEVAQAGDGVTHLARRAATTWLSENQAGYAVTDEHRIYIEDYVQNNVGTQGLEIGDSQLISFDLMTEAVAAAGELSDQQLQNLTQYTAVLQ